MAFFYLVRHGQNDFLGKALAARLPDINLNAQGRAEAQAIASALLGKKVERILSSPLERARETAEPLARRLGMSIEISEQINELGFGDWAGKSMQELELLPEWKLFNTFRSGTRPPGGETMIELQTRMVSAIETCAKSSAKTFAFFSHADPIRTALLYYLGMPLDMFSRIEISPGTYSLLRVENWGAQVLAMNVTPALG
jgi:broad specificity phosphatase PhoE